MKAIVQDRYGAPADVLELQEIPKPAVGDGEVLVRVHAAPVAGDDWHLLRGLPYIARIVTGLRRPKNRVAGLEFAGRVEATGKDVEAFRPGDEVFGWCSGPPLPAIKGTVAWFDLQSRDYPLDRRAGSGKRVDTR